MHLVDPSEHFDSWINRQGNSRRPCQDVSEVIPSNSQEVDLNVSEEMARQAPNRSQRQSNYENYGGPSVQAISRTRRSMMDLLEEGEISDEDVDLDVDDDSVFEPSSHGPSPPVEYD